MADERLLPPGIRDAGNLAINDLLDRIGNLDITPLLIYKIDDVIAAALPFLAEQFHVGGWEGWLTATTETEKRELIRQAIELHRKKGTPWAVKEAIKAVGYADVELEEGLPLIRHDGEYLYGGDGDYGGGARWALFRAIIDLGENKGVAAEDLTMLRGMIAAWKNARSHLERMTFRTTVADEIVMTETSTVQVIHAEAEVYPHGRRYDGAFRYDGVTRRLYDGSLAYGGHADHSGLSAVAMRYDNAWETFGMDMAIGGYEDPVLVTPQYDGAFYYAGITYGEGNPPAPVDLPMTLTVTRHYRYDGRHHYSGDCHDGTRQYDGVALYYAGIGYHGDISAVETV